jgi:hypothetical protein
VSEAVRCDVCGLMYNSSYVSAHKRRAHPEKFKQKNPGLNEADAILRILSLFQQLSPEGQKNLLNRLHDSGQKIA